MTEPEITRLVAGGDGLGFVDGKAVFVPGVLPGERVRVRVVQRRRDFDRAALVEVLEPPSTGLKPGCRYAGLCGGCDWLHMDYAEQLRQKVSIVTEALRRTGHIEREDPQIEDSAPWQAPNRAQVHRADGGGLGYMGARSVRVVSVAECPIVAAPIQGLFTGTPRRPKALIGSPFSAPATCSPSRAATMPAISP